ncbi:hypothetical protein Bca4012_065891 [Brassica carinata]|uniref:Uncharacterized protein n=1 Tax=Brassica carinata TaxID=52824 RepID=A0A8X7VQH5_BRACI|nr:hypothetical protein Bca52824_018212 [Brassica carinata]
MLYPPPGIANPSSDDLESSKSMASAPGNGNHLKPPPFDLDTLFEPPSGPYPPRGPFINSQMIYAPPGNADSRGMSAKLPESAATNSKGQTQ